MDIYIGTSKKDPLKRGHNRNTLSTKDKGHTSRSQLSNVHFPTVFNTLLTTDISRQNGWLQRVCCSEVPLYIVV